MIRLAASICLCFFYLNSPCTAEPYPDSVDIHINDFADVIDKETETATRAVLETLLRETGVEMSIVTLRTRRDYDISASVEDFAEGLFNSWGIGRSDANDGILLLVATADRETRIQLGAAYDQSYDVIAQDIISTDMLPDFREKRFAEGIETGTIEIINRIALRRATNAPGALHPDAKTGLFERLDGWIFGMLFVGIIAYGFLGRRAGDAMTRLRRCPGCGRRALRRSHIHTSDPSTDGADIVRSRVTCHSCDYRDERERRVVRQGKRGGQRSFGGGRSSGGGASGKW